MNMNATREEVGPKYYHPPRRLSGPAPPADRFGWIGGIFRAAAPPQLLPALTLLPAADAAASLLHFIM